jgi:DNA sulfur modification protein DndD
MIIKEIELYNFRIYKGQNTIKFGNESKKNIQIISGKNGYGKTTFLMSLVWCLYGKQMQDVDDLYDKEISEQGGYNKYISNSLNRLARQEGETNFYVSITFTDLNIPEVPCKEIRIIRSFDVETGIGDKVEILIDNYENELTNEVGPEIFIRDFLLPKEIAKFFFFDAEKIVNLAEITTAEQRKKLSEAYSEVLGIKKYEDLKKELENLQLSLRQESASKKEQELLIQIQANISKRDIEISECEEKIRENKENINSKRLEANQIQEKLIRAGSSITVEELNLLKSEENILSNKQTELQEELKNSFEIIPFAICGSELLQISLQLTNESNYRISEYKNENINEITNKILTDLLKEPKPENLPIDNKVHLYYSHLFEKLIRKHFFSDIPDLPTDFQAIHDFSETEKNELNSLLNNIKFGFRETFKRINAEYNLTRNEINRIRKKIKDAESHLDDPIIADFRKKKEDLDKDVIRHEETIASLNREIGEYNNEKVQNNKRVQEISKKLEVSEQNKSKYEVASNSINSLKEFISKFKEEKKKSLEKQILKGLEILMHKKGFIKNVKVEIVGDDIDIILYNNRNEEIKKEGLSKGEQQMYATALLRGLVEESDIDFPIFIDSPMQKFDEQHAENIVKYFYPQIAEQVIIFPLMNKELNEREYKILLPNVSKTFLIKNINQDKSEFLEINPQDFFKTYNELYNNVN